MVFRKGAMWLAAGALATVLGACGEAPEVRRSGSVSDPSAVAAMVNGEPIYVSDVDLEARVKGLIGRGERLEADSAEFNEILDELIDVKLLALEAVSRGLDEDPESRHRLATARDNILGNILVDAIVQDRVDEAAIRKMYETQIAIWELGDEARIRHIVAPTREDIDKIIAELKAGADFAVLASRKSTDEATRMEGGDLGYMTEEEATPEFAKVIRETPTGGVSRPFQTDMGWHVAKIDERRKEQPPSIEELRTPILKHLTMMQIGEVLKELRKEAKVEKHTSPRNSTLEVDPFSTAPEVDEVPAPPPQSFEASASRGPVSESRQGTDAGAASEPGVTTTKTPASASPAPRTQPQASTPATAPGATSAAGTTPAAPGGAAP